MEQSALLTDEQKNRIVWEPEPAENAGQSRNALSDEQFGRIVWDSEPAIEPGQYTPTQRQWGSFFSAFSEDPLLVIPDGIAREALRRGVAALPDPEQEKKKIALAAYYTQGNPDNFCFTLGNLDGFIERYHGRKLSPDAAFGEVAAILAGEQAEASKGALKKTGEAVAGMGQNAWYGFGSFLLKAGHGIREPLMPLVEGHFNLDKIGRISREREREKFAATTRDAWLRGQQTALNRFYESLEPWSRRQLKAHYDQRIAELERQRHAMAGETKGRRERLDADDATTWSEDYRNRWKTVFDGLEEKAAEAQRKYHTDKTIAEHFADGEFGGALLESLAVAVDQVGQSVIPQAAAFLAGGPAASAAALAASSMGERSNQLTGLGKNSPEVLASATIYAAAEAIPEYFLGLVPIFKMFKGTGKKATAEAVTGVRRKIGRFLKDFAGSGASDTTGELITFTAEKLQDFIEGVNTPDNKRLWEMSRSEIVEFSLEGLPETIVGSFLTAGPLGAVGAIQERRALIEMDRQRQEALRTVKNRRDELLNKENPTGEEVREIQQLNTVLDAGNINKSAKLVEEVQAVTELKAADEAQQPTDPDSEMDVQELADEAEAEYWTRQQTLAHNPADTADRVRELAALYPGVNTEVVDDPAMFSDAARTEAARREIDLDNVRGFYDPATNTMVVNAARVRPSEVPALALHEIVGHAGLKQVLGNAYEQVLDGVIRDHRDDLGTIPLRYNLDLDTVKGQREAAEEYIAHIAESNPDLKPSWWREFLQQIKMLLRRVPGLENLRYTDREIEAMLARSARAMRRSGKVPPPDARANALWGRADGEAGDGQVRTGTEAEMRFAVNENGETLFGVAGRDGNLTARRIIDDRSIRPDEPVLTSDGSDVWGEITPEMAAAAPELGLEALPIKLLKGRHTGPHTGYGLAHVYKQHGAELEARGYDLAEYLIGIFSRPHQIYASSQGGNIRLELVNKSKPRDIGVLELRKEDGFYSVITAFPQDFAHYKMRGELVWRYTGSKPNKISQEGSSVISAGKQRTSPLEPLSAENAAGTARVTRPKPDSNINDSGEKSSTSDDDGIRFSIAPVWTGSAADYDRPSLHYIGTGEGAQAYGWGLYGSSDRGIATGYAERDVKNKFKQPSMKINGETFTQGNSAALTGKEEWFGVLLQHLYSVNGSRKQAAKNIRDGIRRLRNLAKSETDGKELEFYQAMISDLKRAADFLADEGNTVEYDGGRNIYKQTFWPDKEENLLDWDEPVPPEQMQQIADQAVKEQLPFGYTEDGKNFFNGSGTSGELLYKDLAKSFNLGSPQAVSEFLYRAGIDGITYIGDASGVRNYVAFSDQDIRVDEHLRFSVSEYSDQDMETFATILRPFVGLAMDKTDAEYLAYLQEKNLPVHSEEWAHAFAVMANEMNREAQKRAQEEKKFNWLYENIPFYRYAVDAAGTHDFKIVPSHRFAGEEFTGTFIAEAWRKFSGKEKAEGKTGARRKKKLEEAAGIRSDALAETIARDIGGDAIQIENDLIDFFRDLDKRKLGSKYSDYRKESAFHDKEQEREARQEFEALRREEERNRIEEEAYSILAEGREITEEYRKAEPEVVKLVRDRLLGEQAKQYTNQQELEAINAAIRQEAGNAATYAQAYRDAREKAWQEYNERYRQLRDRVMESKADALKLQREAAAFAEKYLPPEARGEFSRRIIGLLEYSTLPNKKYPEGRRKAEFDRLQQDILNRSGEVNKTKLLGEIKELLDANKTRHNYKGIPTSAAPATQQQIDRIRFIASMNLPAAAAAIEANNTRIAELEEAGDAETAIADLRLDNTLLSTFAGLNERPAEAVREARRLLGSVILHGRAILKEQLAARQERLRRMRADVIADLTDGGMEVQGNKDGNQHAAYPLRLNSISGTLKLLSGRSIEDLANTVSGGFLRRIEDASWNESTEIRRVDDALMQAYRDIAKTENVFQRAKFIRKVYTEVEHSGVFRNVYAQTREIAKNRYILRVGKRELLRRNIPVEQARDLLRRIDAGEKVELYQDIPLTEAGLHFLRLQLADYDAGLKPAYEIFGDEQDDAQFNRMLESEAKNANLQLFAPDQGEAPPVRQEEKLSPGAALQILLTWEQPHYRPGMEWNGWTEESMEQIRKFIGPEVLQFGYWMRDFIRSRQKQLDRAVYERYGAHLPENPNYFPANFRESVKSKVREDRGGMGRGVGTMSVNPNFLIARKFHLKPVDTSVNAFEVFLNNQLETIHFLNWSETVRDLRSVYSNRDVQEAIDNQLGRNVKAKLFEGINALAQNGVPGGDAGVKAINKLIRLWVPSNIAINPGSWIKQMLGAIAYSNNMPLTEWAKYSSRAAFWNADFREFAELAGNSDYMKNRMHGSLNKELQFMLSRSRSAEHYNPLLDSMMEYATWGTRATDYWASIHGGYAIYAYNRDKALAAGRSAAEATAIGLRQWQRATDQTQQSAYIKDQNSYQLNQGLYRFLTVYQSNPMQILGLQLDNLNRLRYGDKKAARKELAKMIFINHLVIPPLMLAVNEILRNGFDFEEWDWEDFFIAAAFGNLSSAFLWGQFLFNASNAAADKLLHRPMWRTSDYSALPMLDDATNSLTQLIGLVDKDEITEKDMLSSMQSIGNLMMTTAPFPGAAGAISKAGAVMKFTTTQAKRIYNLFSEK